MKRALLALTALTTLAGCAAPSPKPLAQSATVETALPGAAVFTPEPAEVTTTTAAPVELASSCDVAREALLTGTQGDINAAMAALQADRTADATAREYADYYLHRDAGEPQLRSMDVNLIRMSCAG